MLRLRDLLGESWGDGEGLADRVQLGLAERVVEEVRVKAEETVPVVDADDVRVELMLWVLERVSTVEQLVVAEGEAL